VEEIENEIRAVTKLCSGNEHANVVAALRSGKLPGSPYYFIDMELCDFNLEIYIANQWINDLEKKYRARQVFTILSDISNGVAFLHSHDEVHRDMKPRNGKASNARFNTSYVFWSYKEMEDYGLQSDHRRQFKRKSVHAGLPRDCKLSASGINTSSCGKRFIQQQS